MLVGCWFIWLVGWLVGWLVFWLVGWLVGWPIGWLKSQVIGWKIELVRAEQEEFMERNGST